MRWGAHNGASRAFASVRSNVDAEEKLAEWLGVEAVLIYPSVTLANHGAIPGLAGRKDAVALDEQAHNSMQEAAKIAKANGAKVASFAHSDPAGLEKTLKSLRPYRNALVCIDGVYSMSGAIPPMRDLDAVARAPGRRALHRRCARHGRPRRPRAGDGARSAWRATTTRSSSARCRRRSRARAGSSAARRRSASCCRSARTPIFSAARSCRRTSTRSARWSTSSARTNTRRSAAGSIATSRG